MILQRSFRRLYFYSQQPPATSRLDLLDFHSEYNTGLEEQGLFNGPGLVKEALWCQPHSSVDSTTGAGWGFHSVGRKLQQCHDTRVAKTKGQVWCLHVVVLLIDTGSSGAASALSFVSVLLSLSSQSTPKNSQSKKRALCVLH